MDLWFALEHSALGEVMRRSRIFYPAANVAHILALLTFFASVAVMDARLLGVFRQLPWRKVSGLCRPVAYTAFGIQATSGFLLLAPDAVALVANPAFRLKLAMIALGLANAATLEIVMRNRSRQGGDEDPSISSGARICAVISIVAWLLTAALGRLIAYT